MAETKAKTSKDLVKLNVLRADVTALVAPMHEFKCLDTHDAQDGVDALKKLKEFKKRVESVRTSLVEPLNQRVKAINEFARQVSGPIDSAETTMKRELVRFETEQERVREEARRKAEEEARKKAEDIARREAEEREQLDVVAEMFGTDEEAEAKVSEQYVAEQAALTNEHSAALEDINRDRIKNTRKVWKCELVDIELVPKEFVVRTLNQKAVLELARNGQTKVAGVRIWQELELAIGANTRVPAITDRKWDQP